MKSPIKRTQHLNLVASRQQTGFSLLEVLIAIIVLTIGFFGVAALQLQTIKEQRSAQFYGRAAVLAGEMVERMRANRLGVSTTQYLTPTDYSSAVSTPPAAPSCGFAQLPACTDAASMSVTDLFNWQTSIASSLSGGAGMLLNTNYNSGTLSSNARTVVIVWREPVIDRNLGVPTPTKDPSCPNSISAPDGARCYVVPFVL